MSVWRKLKSGARAEGLLGGGILLFSGTAAGQGLLLLSAPVLTRLYSVADFGLLSVYVSLVSVVAVVASLRYELAIPIAEDEQTAALLLMLSLLTIVGTAALLFLLVYLVGGAIAQWTGTPALRPYLWSLPLSIMGAGLCQALNYWGIRRRAFGRIARTKLSQSGGQVLAQIGLGLLKAGPVGLLAGDVLGRAAGSLTLARVAWKEDADMFKGVDFQGMRRVAYRYRRFPLMASVSGLMNTFGSQLPPLMMAGIYGPQVAGWYGLGQRAIGAPVALLGQAIAQAYLSEAARLARQDPAGLNRLYLKTAGRLAAVGAIPMLVLALAGPWLFSVAFGPEWREAGLYMRGLAPMLFGQFVMAPLSQTLNVLERQDLQMTWDMGRLLVVLALFFRGHRHGLSPTLTVGIYGWGMAVAYLALFAVTVHQLRGGGVQRQCRRN